MQLTRLSIENFKGIRDRVEVDLRPITLLFGANSVGKSTLLQALLYFRELLERQNVDADRLLVSGASIDLGGFRQFVHKHDLGRKVRIGVTATADDDSLPLYPSHDLPSDLTVLSDITSTPVTAVAVEVEVAWDDSTNRPWITAYSVAINGRQVGMIHAEPNLEAHLTELDRGHGIFKDNDPAPEEDTDDSILSRSLDELRTKLSSHTTDSPGWKIPLGRHVIPAWGKALPFNRVDLVMSEQSEGMSLALAHSAISSIMVGAGELILHQLQRLRYIGPLRTIPARGFLAQSSPSADRWADGSAAWDLLHQSVAGTGSSDLLAKTSAIIADPDKLNLGYRLEGRAIFEVPARGFALNTLQALAQSAEDVEVEARLKLVLDDLRSQPRRTQLALIDQKSETEVDPIDIGAGVTQSIPIVVGVIDPHAGIVVVEQPELHTHPAVQCNLGDVFARAVRADQDRLFLIETHSEHLLLRLMKRIRQTARGETDDTALQLRQSDVAVVFVETYEGRTIFREMPLNEHGELVKAWPGGFFEEDLNEML